MSRDAALALAKKGFKVFRADGKVPVGSFTTTATHDEATIRGWWDDLSTNWNVGILCDELLVLDFDLKNGAPGVADYATARERWGDLEPAIARTPSGGWHMYFRLPADVKVAGSIKKIGKATDVKSWHGLVVGPGSEGYRWEVEPEHLIDVPLAPPDLIELCGKAPEPKVEDPNPAKCPLDTNASVASAIDYLFNHAPRAEIGNRDSTAYKVAARLRDLGISKAKCVDMLLDHWDEQKVDPPLGVAKIEKDVDNAYKYAQNPLGSRVPGSEFEPVALTPKRWPSATPYELPDEKDVPPRQWLVKGILARGYVTALVAPSGSGKTQWLAQLFLAAATGRGEIINSEMTGRYRVWSWNQEDDFDELNRRIRVGASAYGVDAKDISGQVFVDSGVEKALMLAARDENGAYYRTRYVKELIEEIREKKIDILVVDPLIEFHEGEEDNKGLHFIGKQLRYVAQMTKCAVILGHHTKKPEGASSDGFAGNADASRGGTALQGVTRIMLTLFSMSVNDAKAWGIPQEARSQYVRLDSAKSNISPSGRGSRPDWFLWKSRTLANGEDVGVMEVARLHNAASRVQRINAITDAVVERIKSHPPGRLRWADIAKEIVDEKILSLDKLKKWMAEQESGLQAFDGGSLKITKGAKANGIWLEWIPGEPQVSADWSNMIPH